MKSGAVAEIVAPKTISVEPATFEFKGEGETKEFAVKTDVEIPMGYSIEAKSADNAFVCTMSEDFKSLKVVAAPNKSGEDKNDVKITLTLMKGVTATDVTTTLLVSQKQAVLPIELVTSPMNGASYIFASDAASEFDVQVKINGGDPYKTYTFKAELTGANADKFSATVAQNAVVVKTLDANTTTADFEAVLKVTVLENNVATSHVSEITLKQPKKEEGGSGSGLTPGVFQLAPANYEMQTGDKITFLWLDTASNTYIKRLNNISPDWAPNYPTINCEVAVGGTVPEADINVFLTAQSNGDGSAKLMGNGNLALNTYGRFVDPASQNLSWKVDSNSNMVNGNYIICGSSSFGCGASPVSWGYTPYYVFVCPAK